ncbi:iron-siderophore ABC transporter substrate-binding protein [Curtobacterium sp. MCBD17_034]|uniref:ABC transporter substrate-binding protein n=1 Tax=unclassified Curtobacterium TaxID=257496 RepID=UPI000DA6E5A4|nr:MULTISPECIES: iron-siderophore ABC transporter substrate-binding protein [unclassified Curtobacterium]PZF56186.1 iron-siderophore ABC transporter substrate-binding protein [Curtobacterium sp. MCBD17_034]PZM32949.1 iron-siderophore ABC transporter substrate-binding protein [Curtobacterium sp. MCBD17_031]
MKRIITAAALAVTAAVVLTGCGTTEATSSTSSSTAGAITITDATGTKVQLDGPATKVVGTEWNVVEDLVALGVQPVGVADPKGYGNWDTAAPLTGSPKDIGTRGEPSTDTIASLAPDLIVATTDLSAATLEQLRAIAPVVAVRSADASHQIEQMTTDLDMIATATGRQQQAAKVMDRFHDAVAAGKEAITKAGLAGDDFAFADDYEVSNQVTIRPYADGSLIGDVTEELGLHNAWDVTGDGSYGLGSTDVEGLTKLPSDVQFLYLANDADGGDVFTSTLGSNAVWKSLPFVAAGHVHRLHDGIWLFGGPASMTAYVHAVVAALRK